MSVGVVGLLFLARGGGRGARVQNFRDWPPGPQEIRKAVDDAKAAVRGDASLQDTAGRCVFKSMFQKRYRQHDPPEAVGLHFEGDSRIRLLVPARMEPFNIDIIAEQVFDESRADFGRPYRVSIFATYLGGMPARHIADLTPGASGARRATIEYVRGERSIGSMP
jgi:hypothetical protein